MVKLFDIEGPDGKLSIEVKVPLSQALEGAIVNFLNEVAAALKWLRRG